jgi:hypothetical protein
VSGSEGASGCAAHLPLYASLAAHGVAKLMSGWRALYRANCPFQFAGIIHAVTFSDSDFEVVGDFFYLIFCCAFCRRRFFPD